MIRFLAIQIYRFLEILKREDFYIVLKKLLYQIRDYIYLKKEIITIEIDLSNINPTFGNFTKFNFNILEITEESFDHNKQKYPLKSWYFKSLGRVKKGYKSFALINDNKIIGYLWYTTTGDLKSPKVHHDLKLLNITLTEKEVYLFDMYIMPENRGNTVATHFMGCVLNKLKEKGYLKGYSYVFADNLPALYTYRLLKWKELDRLILQRLFFVRTAIPKS